MQETFKDVIGYEGLYKVSNLGRVKSLWFGKEKIKTNQKTWDGYLYTGLTQNRKIKNFRIHRLIGIHFIDNPENKKEINHKNGIKDDNRIENLEWVTKSENGLHKYKVLGYHSISLGKFGKNNHSSKKVNQYDLKGNLIKTWDCIKDIQRELGIDSSAISKSCLGKLKTSGGFKWKYFNL